MYSGTTLTRFSGHIFGAHQKLDRLARRHLAKQGIDASIFPSIKEILQFEGKNGPDAIKRKSPAHDEPWHYFNPFEPQDTQLLDLIDEHYRQLVRQLKAGNRERSSFEAAWLAHAITDGLTPAHHYPYEEKLIELRGGAGIESRTTIKQKLVMPGDTTSEKLLNNWKMWGAKGLFTTHGLFELGVATLIKPLTLSDVALNSDLHLEQIRQKGLVNYFVHTAREVAVLDMYKRYYKKGWTPKLAYDVRHKLAPAIVSAITVAWYLALEDAGLL